MFYDVVFVDKAPARQRIAHSILLKCVSKRGDLTDRCPDTSKLPAVSRTRHDISLPRPVSLPLSMILELEDSLT